jgi:hypothetical protein
MLSTDQTHLRRYLTTLGVTVAAGSAVSAQCRSSASCASKAGRSRPIQYGAAGPRGAVASSASATPSPGHSDIRSGSAVRWARQSAPRSPRFSPG